MGMFEASSPLMLAWMALDLQHGLKVRSPVGTGWILNAVPRQWHTEAAALQPGSLQTFGVCQQGTGIGEQALKDRTVCTGDSGMHSRYLKNKNEGLGFCRKYESSISDLLTVGYEPLCLPFPRFSLPLYQVCAPPDVPVKNAPGVFS